MLCLCSLLFLLHHINPILTDPSVIVIGAGPAGIAAATKLFENSITNITILEAENRIGGRINSIEFVNGIVDLGAQYCHGKNVAYELAKNLNILEPGLRGLQNNVYYSNGSRLDSAFIQELKHLYLTYTKTENLTFNVTGRSIGDLLTYRYKSTILTKYEKDESKKKILEEGLRYLEGYIVIHEGSFSWFDSSAERDYKKCEGNQGLIWKGLGYKAVLDIMMKSYPDLDKKLPIDNKIHLNARVQKVVWNNSQIVNVVTSKRTYQADYVIFTPSLGVLKQQQSTLFDPPLPLSKQEAIEATGFGCVMKIFFHFPTKWWSDEDQAFGFFWNEDDLNSVQPELSWITQFRYILKVPYNPNVWVGWVSGDSVPNVEKLSINDLKIGCKHVLDKFLGNTYNVTTIAQIVRSTWCTNSNFGGTYSFTRTGFYKKGFSYQKHLAEPLYNNNGRPVVLFAGEATNPDHYSTAHGAIETGYREAERIINLEMKQMI